MAAEFTQPLPIVARESTIAGGIGAGGAASAIPAIYQRALPSFQTPVVGNGLEGTITAASIPMPSLPTGVVYLRPKPEGSAPQAPPQLPPISTPPLPRPAPTGPPLQRSKLARIATYAEDPNLPLLQEDMYDGSCNPILGRICKPEQGEILLESALRNQLLDGPTIVYVRRSASNVNPSDQNGWVFESALQRPAHVNATLRTAEKFYQLQNSDSDRLALVPGMHVTVFSPPGASRSSIPSNTLLVAGVRKDGTLGEPDCFGFVMDSDLAKESIADVPQWPTGEVSARSSTGADTWSESTGHSEKIASDILLVADVKKDGSAGERDSHGSVAPNSLVRAALGNTSMGRPEAARIPEQSGTEPKDTLSQEGLHRVEISELSHPLRIVDREQPSSSSAFGPPVMISHRDLSLLLENYTLLEAEKSKLDEELREYPELEHAVASLDSTLKVLRLENGELRKLHEEATTELLPLQRQLNSLLATNRALEDELDRLKKESTDNLGILFKLRYLLSRERHRAVDIAFQADAKQVEARRLEVVQRRVDLLGTEQQDKLWVTFNKQMEALQQALRTQHDSRVEMEPLVDIVIDKIRGMDNDNAQLQWAINAREEKLTTINQKIAKIEHLMDEKMQEIALFGTVAEQQRGATEGAGLNVESLRRWLKADTDSTIADKSGSTSLSMDLEREREIHAALQRKVDKSEHEVGMLLQEVEEFEALQRTHDAALDESGQRFSILRNWLDDPNSVQLPPPNRPVTSTGERTTASANSSNSVSSGMGDALAKLRASPGDIEINYARQIGEGGFGVVFEGVLKGATRVAVKMIKGGVNPRTAQVFSKEVTVWNGLNQRNVLPLLAFCENPPMMVSELVMGGNLRDRLEELGWNLDAGIRFLQDVAAGMSYLHSFGVLHGDLKSLNILIDRGDVAKITDFGLAKIREHVNRTTGSTAAVKGTLGFMAPELFDGEPLRPPADVYAFAMVIYEVVSKGRWPFEGLHQMVVIRKVCDKQERPARPDGTPDYIWSLMQRCWADDPSKRPTFPQIRAEMERWPL